MLIDVTAQTSFENWELHSAHSGMSDRSSIGNEHIHL